MKNLMIIIILMLITNVLLGQSFVSPIGFVPSETNKQKVIAFIQKQVKEDYTEIGMGDPSTLRMMEDENLNAFKQLTSAKNTTLLREVIKTYCEIGMCNYTTILLMYEEEEKASNKSLKW